MTGNAGWSIFGRAREAHKLERKRKEREKSEKNKEDKFTLAICSLE
jgi:hypothetical protein